MNAKQLVEEQGTTLIGRRVDNEAIGDWPGGVCEVIQLEPDEGSPEIVMQVRSLDSGEEIGVFDYEEISLLED